MRYREHRDKLYPIKEQLLAQISERLKKQYKDLSDKADCLQKSQIYLHNHIGQVENTVNQIREIILRLNIGPLEIYPSELN
jgi:hypothetical protein